MREKIYRHSLVEESDVVLSNYSNRARLASPGLLRSCRQIRAEASEIYYSENTFSIGNVKDCWDWLKFIGPRFCKILPCLKVR